MSLTMTDYGLHRAQHLADDICIRCSYHEESTGVQGIAIEDQMVLLQQHSLSHKAHFGPLAQETTKWKHTKRNTDYTLC